MVLCVPPVAIVAIVITTTSVLEATEEILLTSH